jgi:uncharacterized repeat protein (TIGR01451 family)
MLVASVAGAPRPTTAQAAHTQSPAGPPAVVANKTVSQAQAHWGDTLTYNITLTNTSVVSPATTVLTDTLPLSLVFQTGSLSASQGVFTQTAQVIGWSGVITTSGVVTLSFQAKVIQPGTTINNQAAFWSDLGSGQTPIASTTVGAVRLFLPLVSYTLPPAGIYGHVTLNGSPAAGVPLQLRFFDGANWSTAASLSTAGDGSYLFQPAALGPGQDYYVRFTNPNTTTDNGQLFRWGTREITAYQFNASVPIGDFDIANIELNSPAPGAAVGLPVNFQWTRRPATPGDSYEFDLFSVTSNAPSFFTNPPLGYVGNYLLASLPGGFGTGTRYGWSLVAYSPDGGYGIAYWYYTVTFTNALSGLPTTASVRAGRAADLPAAQLREEKP